MVTGAATAAEKSIDAPAPPPAGSIGFIIVTENGARHVGGVLKSIKDSLRDGDEAIVLTRADRTDEVKIHEPWLRVVGVPNANIFTLRSHIPTVSGNEWLIVLEDHSLINNRAIAAIRDMIQSRPDIELISFLGTNLTSISPWGWANFLHTFGLIWAPIDQKPGLSPVTSVTVRRSSLGTERVLKEGEFELRVIPRIFAGGKIAYSNDIFIDHVKPLNMTGCLGLNFHNARACACLQRNLGVSRGRLWLEGGGKFMLRPGKLARALEPRRHELPPHTFWRVRAVGLAHWIGMIAGMYLGPGQSAHKLD